MALSDLFATKLHFAGTSLAGRTLKMPLAIQKVRQDGSAWVWTQLLPYLFCRPACSLIRLSCRRLTQSAINVNSKYRHQGPSNSLALPLWLPSVCDLSCLSAYQNADSCIWFILGCAVRAIFVLDCAPNWVSYAAFTLDIWYTLQVNVNNTQVLCNSNTT